MCEVSMILLEYSYLVESRVSSFLKKQLGLVAQYDGLRDSMIKTLDSPLAYLNLVSRESLVAWLQVC